MTDGIAFADTRFPLRTTATATTKLAFTCTIWRDRGAASRHFRPLQPSAPQSATLPVRPRDPCQEVIKKTYIASTDDATIRPQDHWQEKPRKSCSNLESCKCDQSRCVPARRLLTFELLPMKIFYVKYAARGCCKYLATLGVKNFAFYDSGPMAK